MPRGGGFFSRVGKAIARIFSALSEPIRREEPPPPPEPGPPPTPTGRRNRYEEIFYSMVDRRELREVRDRTGYSNREIIQHHLELFFSLPGTTEERFSEVIYEWWEEYVDTWITGNLPRSQFYQDFGIHPSNFDWQAWRSAMGYRSKK